MKAEGQAEGKDLPFIYIYSPYFTLKSKMK